jgi:hypothetical protein
MISSFSEAGISCPVLPIPDPWAEWRRGHPLTKTSLAKLLRPFGIKPKQMKKTNMEGGGGANGYGREPILEARKRYCEAKVADEEDVPEVEDPF